MRLVVGDRGGITTVNEEEGLGDRSRGYSQNVMSGGQPDVRLEREDRSLDLDEIGPVIVVGCPRSGTTYLMEALARLKGVVAFNGRPLSDRFFHMLGWEQIQQRAKKELLWGMRHSLWRALLEREKSIFMRLQAVWRGRCTLWEEMHRKTDVVVFKDPLAAFSVNELGAHFSKATFVHIVRDGLDAADSMRRSYPAALSNAVLRDEHLTRQKGTEIGGFRRRAGWCIPWWVTEKDTQRFVQAPPFVRAVMLWRAIVATVHSSSIIDERVYEVRYERLCRSPREVGRELATFVGQDPGRHYWGWLKKSHTESIGIAERRQEEATLNMARGVGGELLQEYSP